MEKYFFAACFTALSASSAFAAPLPPADLLASNSVKASFVGVEDRPCRHLTSECPDKCGHATRIAKFLVIENKGYEKPGQYGDDKAEPGKILIVDVKRDIEGQDVAVAAAIAKLQKGAKVDMTITHYYVNVDGSRWPVRPVTEFVVEPS